MARAELSALVAWLDAWRRDDVDAAAARLDPAVVSHGVREGLACHGPEEVVATFRESLGTEDPIEALELIPGSGCVVLGARRPALREVGGVELHGQVFNVYRLAGERIVEIRDYITRAEALAAAGVAPPAWR
jgi:limonene-1,2-epoxide hydrolase